MCQSYSLVPKLIILQVMKTLEDKPGNKAISHIRSSLLIQAYRRGMTSPRYVYLSFYWYTEFWWKDNITRGSGYTYDPMLCNPEEVAAALHRSLAPDYFPVAPPEESDAATDVGYVSRSLVKEGTLACTSVPSSSDS